MKSGAVLVAGVFAGATSLVLAQTAQSTTGPAVKPTAVVQKAASPTAPAGAKPTKTAGGNSVTVSTANSPTDDDSLWLERMDVDGDGDVEDTSLVWDDEDKVLFAYSAGAFGCKNGGTATAELLIATYGAGNPRNRPVGSGFWVADLDKGECGAQAAAMWGCKFDATGKETMCGVATLDAKNDDLIIAVAKK